MPFPNLRLLTQPNQRNNMSLEFPELQSQPDKPTVESEAFPQRRTINPGGLDDEFAPDGAPASIPVAGLPPAASERPLPQPKQFEGLEDLDQNELRMLLAERRSARVAQTFVEKHPDIVPSPETAEAFDFVLRSRGIDPNTQLTVEHMEAAYQFLKGQGLFEAAEGDPSAPPQPVAPTPRASQPAPVKHFATGLPDRPLTPAPSEPLNTDALAERLSKMDINQAREMMTHLMYATRQQAR